MRSANGNPLRFVISSSVIFAFAAVLATSAPAAASEKRAQTERNSAGETTGQSADGPKDNRDVGEAGGGGEHSGDMRRVEGDRDPATAIPGPNKSSPPSQ